MSSVENTAAWVPLYGDPDHQLTFPFTVPSGLETGTWRARVWTDDRKATLLSDITGTRTDRTITLLWEADDIDAMVPPGQRDFTGWWELDRTPPAEEPEPWFKGPFIIDPRHRPSGSGNALTVTVVNNTVTVTTSGPSMAEIGSVIHADPARVVKATWRSVAVSAVGADGWYLHDGTLAAFTDRRWPVIWEGTAAQIPAQGDGDAQLQTGDIAVTRTTTL